MSVEAFEGELKSVVSKGKLSSSAVDELVSSALSCLATDSLLVSALYRVHKRAQASNKITSLYIIDAIARAAKKEAKGSHKGKEKDDGSQASSFLQKLEAVLGKIVSHNWEEGLPEHREKVRRVLDIWGKASTFSSATLSKVSKSLSTDAPPAAVSGSTTPPVEPADAGPASIPANVLALLGQAAPPKPPAPPIDSNALRIPSNSASGSMTPLALSNLQHQLSANRGSQSPLAPPPPSVSSGNLTPVKRDNGDEPLPSAKRFASDSYPQPFQPPAQQPLQQQYQAKPFTPTSAFDATDPACWAGYADFLRSTVGRVPSNEEMMQMVMTYMMAMQQAQAQATQMRAQMMPLPSTSSEPQQQQQQADEQQ